MFTIAFGILLGFVLILTLPFWLDIFIVAAKIVGFLLVVVLGLAVFFAVAGGWT